MMNLPDSLDMHVYLRTLHEFNPTQQPQNLRNSTSSKTVKRGERERKNPNSNYLRSKTQISKNMIALFPRCTRSSSYRGQLIENSNTDRVLTSHTVDLNNSRSRQLT